MTRFKMKFFNFFRSDRARKIFASCLLIAVFSSFFCIYSSAEDTSYTLAGKRLFVDDPDLSTSLASNDSLMYVSSGSPIYNAAFQSNDNSFLGFSLFSSSFVGPQLYSGTVVYSTDSGWLADEYKIVDFGSGVTVDSLIYSWVVNNSSVYDDSVYLLSGKRSFVSTPYVSPCDSLMYVSSGTPTYSVPFESNGNSFLGFSPFDSTFVGPQLFQGNSVYSIDSGWLVDEYKIVDFGEGVYVDSLTYNWVTSNSSVYESSIPDVTYRLSGQYVFNSIVDLSLFNDLISELLVFKSNGLAEYSVSFVSQYSRFIGFSVYDSDDDVSGGIVVYSAQNGWISPNYRFVDFGSGVNVNLYTYQFVQRNAVPYTDSIYEDGYFDGYNDALNSKELQEKFYQQGYDSGYSDGYSLGLTSGESSGYDSGYLEGFAAGRNSTDSENLGQNLLGDTLSAPMQALNQFTLYESTSGFKVTLGLVVGGAISLSLFIAFLKIFAGG